MNMPDLARACPKLHSADSWPYSVHMVTNHPRSVTEATAHAVAAEMRWRGISTLALAGRTGISRTTLTRRMRTGEFTVPELERIALSLGMRPSELLRSAEERQRRS